MLHWNTIIPTQAICNKIFFGFSYKTNFNQFWKRYQLNVIKIVLFLSAIKLRNIKPKQINCDRPLRLFDFWILGNIRIIPLSQMWQRLTVICLQKVCIFLCSFSLITSLTLIRLYAKKTHTFFICSIHSDDVTICHCIFRNISIFFSHRIPGSNNDCNELRKVYFCLIWVEIK